MQRIVHAWILALSFVSGSALADGSFTGRTRFDLDRAEIREFVEATAKSQKMEPLDVYRLLAKADRLREEFRTRPPKPANDSASAEGEGHRAEHDAGDLDAGPDQEQHES